MSKNEVIYNGNNEKINRQSSKMPKKGIWCKSEAFMILKKIEIIMLK